MQVTQFNEIFNFILQMAAFIGVMPDVIVKMTEFRGVASCSVFAQWLWPAVMDLLLDGRKYIFPSFYEFCVLGVLGDISLFS